MQGKSWDRIPLLLPCWTQKTRALLNSWKKEDKNPPLNPQSRGWAQSSPFTSPEGEDATRCSSCPGSPWVASGVMFTAQGVAHREALGLSRVPRREHWGCLVLVGPACPSESHWVRIQGPQKMQWGRKNSPHVWKGAEECST